MQGNKKYTEIRRNFDAGSFSRQVNSRILEFSIDAVTLYMSNNEYFAVYLSSDISLGALFMTSSNTLISSYS